MQRTIEKPKRNINELSTEELLEKFKQSSKELNECLQRMVNIFNILSESSNQINKKARQEIYLKIYNTDYLQEKNKIKNEFENLANELQTSFDNKKNILFINEFENKWNGAVSINCELKIKIKNSSKMKVNLTFDDIEQATIMLTIEDLFDNFKFSTSREIDKSFIKVPEEDPTVKITRLINAKLEHEKSSAYQVLSFFNRHPVISSAGFILGSALVGVAVGFTCEIVAKRMGYTK